MAQSEKEQLRNDVLDSILVSMVNEGEHGLNAVDILVSYMNNVMLQEERDDIMDLLKKEEESFF